MLAQGFIVSMLALSCADVASSQEARSLVDTMDALLAPVKDFRCEYEGRIYIKEEQAIAAQKLKPDGLCDEFSGIFVWKQGGDVLADSMHRHQPRGTITHDRIVVRMWQNQAQQFQKKDEAPLGYATIDSPKNINANQLGCLGELFWIDEIKRLIADPQLACSVTEEVVDGQPLKVLNVGLNGVPDSLMRRFWIDLGRTGHVVRMETYAPGTVADSRMEIKLSPFKVADTDIWMPTYGDFASYATAKDGKPFTSKDPTILETIYINGGSLEFNQDPGRDTFKIDYKPGTPVSDKLRQLRYEFGQQKVTGRESKREIEASLLEQVSEAEKQGRELFASSPSRRRDWWPLFVWSCGGTAFGSSLLLWILRHRR